MSLLRWAARHREVVDSIVLVAPFSDPAVRVPDVPTTLLLGTCDADARSTGAGYLAAAHRSPGRTQPSWRRVVRGANHDFYNATLVKVRSNDAAGDRRAACVKARRVRADAQQSFLARIASDHFSHTLAAGPAAAWRAPGSVVRTRRRAERRPDRSDRLSELGSPRAGASGRAPGR